MMKDKLKAILQYAGIPVIGIVLLLLRLGHADAFRLLLGEIVIAFAYVAAVEDIKTKSIKNGLMLTMLGAWVLALVPKLFIDTDAAVILLKDAVFGFLIGGGIFLLVYIISRKGLGGGDVKFMAAAGLYMGFAGTLSAVIYGTFLAALIGLVLLLLKKIGRKDSMPLVPFLYIGILLTVFSG